MHYSIKLFFLCLCLNIFPVELSAVVASNQAKVTQQKVKPRKTNKERKASKRPKDKARTMMRLARASVIFGGLSFIIPPLALISLILARATSIMLRFHKGEEPEGLRELLKKGRKFSIGTLIFIGAVAVILFLGAIVFLVSAFN